MILAPALGNVASNKLTANERAAPVDLSGRVPCGTGHGSHWISPIMSVRFMSIFWRGCRNRFGISGCEGCCVPPGPEEAWGRALEPPATPSWSCSWFVVTSLVPRNTKLLAKLSQPSSWSCTYRVERKYKTQYCTYWTYTWNCRN